MENETLDHARRVLDSEPTKREFYRTALAAVHRAGAAGIGRFELEDAMRALLEAQTQYQGMGVLVDALVKVGAVEERLPEPEFDEATQESHVDAAGIRYFANDLGAKLLEHYDPAARFEALVDGSPEYREAFLDVLEFCCAQARGRADLEERLDELCKQAPNPEHRAQQGLYPSYFMDRLQGAGVIAWNGGWTTTEAGKACLVVCR